MGWIKPDVQDIVRYLSWLDLNLYGGMAYLASERHIRARENPLLVWPETASILVLSTTYAHPESIQVPIDGIPHGRIASYAWQTDYHTRLQPVFAQIADEIEQRVRHLIRWKGFTDSAPILERQMAVQAGLGWIGKNGCLIHPEGGSFTLLGEVFTDLPWSKAQALPDTSREVIPDRCGTCRLCLDHCPTGCIRDDRTLDASRCISYLTIEDKGVIPRDLRPLMGNWVFGCDICQAICPWNRKHVIKPEGFQLAIPTPYPDLLQQSLWNEDEFNDSYRGTAIIRPKWKGFIRNCVVALGNAGQPVAGEVLTRLLKHSQEPLIRLHAAGAVGRYTGVTILQALTECSQNDPDERVREECRISLKEMQD
jgi:epoxyqueuosine reductase